VLPCPPNMLARAPTPLAVKSPASARAVEVTPRLRSVSCNFSIQRPRNAHPGGVFGQAELFADFRKGTVFKMAQQNRFPIRRIQRVNRNHPGVGESCAQSGSGAGELKKAFMAWASCSRWAWRNSVRRVLAAMKLGAGIKPGGQGSMLRQLCGFSGEIGEDGLRDFLGERRVSVDLPERGGINKIHIPPDDFLEGRLGGIVRITPEQFTVCAVHSSI